MKYVFDSSVAFKWVIPEADSATAIRLRDEALQGLHELIAPDVFPAEIAHAMSRAERQGRVSATVGWQLWLEIMADAPAMIPYLPLVPRAYAISSTFRIGFYDCLYVSLAERDGCEIVTADTKLIANLGTHFPFIKHLSAI